MELAIIVAAAENHVIGRDNGLTQVLSKRIFQAVLHLRFLPRLTPVPFWIWAEPKSYWDEAICCLLQWVRKSRFVSRGAMWMTVKLSPL